MTEVSMIVYFKQLQLERIPSTPSRVTPPQHNVILQSLVLSFKFVIYCITTICIMGFVSWSI